MVTEGERENTNTAVEVDRISQMPDSLRHHVLSFLPDKDAARTSILSKSWNEIWSTCPTLCFRLCYKDFVGKHGGSNQESLDMANKQQFLNLVDGSLRRPLQQNLNLCRFRMWISFPSLELLSPRMDRWVCTAVERNVQNLKLFVFAGSRQYYQVPQTVLSAKSLTSLKLYRCKLEGKCDIKPFQLQKLSLRDCILDEQMFQNLVSCCASIEYLSLTSCQGLNSLRLVPSLLRLKRVHLNTRLKGNIEVEAPNLHTLKLLRWPTNLQINFAAYIALKELKLSNAMLIDEQFQNLMSHFPDLETLKLNCCKNLERIKISSQKLKKLVLFGNSKLKDVEADTPNLLSISLMCPKMPSINMVTWPPLQTLIVEFWVKSRDNQCAESKKICVKSNYSENLKFVYIYF